MKANELRIGNLITFKGKVRIVDGVSLCGSHLMPRVPLVNLHYMYQEKELLNINKLEPIPLTEEWLLKLRSRESLPVNYKNIYIMLDRFLLTYQASYGFWYVYDFSCEEMLYITKVEFVHEWQNVYFALNGEELTLTEHPTPAS